MTSSVYTVGIALRFVLKRPLLLNRSSKLIKRITSTRLILSPWMQARRNRMRGRFVPFSTQRDPIGFFLIRLFERETLKKVLDSMVRCAICRE